MRRYKPIYAATETRYPDVNDDGFCNSSDAQIIETAAAAIGAGDPSGLTHEQELRADADRDGTISASDAALVLMYASDVGAGHREDSVGSWAEFLGEIKTIEVV